MSHLSSFVLSPPPSRSLEILVLHQFEVESVLPTQVS